MPPQKKNEAIIQYRDAVLILLPDSIIESSNIEHLDPVLGELANLDTGAAGNVPGQIFWIHQQYTRIYKKEERHTQNSCLYRSLSPFSPTPHPPA
jgi:hypothetical protein